MASTYSPSLRLELIGTGEQSGLWGDTTNNNLGALLEQAITGVASIPITDDPAGYTLTSLNGSVDEARNAVLVITSIAALTGSRNVFIPAEEKLYVVKNSTTGGQNIVIKTSGGTGFTVPNGVTASIYCDGTNCYTSQNFVDAINVSGNATIGGNATISGNLNVSGTITGGWAYLPAGTNAVFAQAAAPTGWTQVTTSAADNRMIRVVTSAGGGYGGSASPILMDVVPSHTHTYSSTSGAQSNDHYHGYSGNTGGQSNDHTHNVSDPGHAHGIAAYTNVAGSAGVPAGPPIDALTSQTNSATTGISLSGATANHTHAYSGNTGGISAGHTHAISGTTATNGSASNWTPKYLDVIVCTKS